MTAIRGTDRTDGEEEAVMARKGWRRSIVAVAVVLSVMVATAGPVRADEDESRFAKDFGYGVGAFFTNLIYMPAKFVYATLGGITGGFAYILTGFRYDVARNIWVPSTGGDYVVTPSMLRGDDPIYFSGTTRPHEEHSSRSTRDEEDLGAEKPHGGAPTAY
jgi:hypothetical protein